MRIGSGSRFVAFAHPIVQAPMAGVSTPELAAAVAQAGGLGSLGIGASKLSDAREAIRRTRALTQRPFNVNVFAHAERSSDPAAEARWALHVAPFFAAQGGQAPARLSRIYASFQGDEALLDMLCEERPGVVSFHFGCPERQAVERLKASGAVLLATATSLAEASTLLDAGMDALVAQGFEAGGHRGLFDENGPDERLGTRELTVRLTNASDVPVIAAGGLMDGADIARALSWGAVGAQLGTAFVAAHESAAGPHYRARLAEAGPDETVMTRAISGRPARGLKTPFTQGLTAHEARAPVYPNAYDAYKQLAALAGAKGDAAYSALWAGSGAHRSRALSAAALMDRLAGELAAARG